MRFYKFALTLMLIALTCLAGMQMLRPGIAQASSQKAIIWVGQGDDVSWTDPGNWSPAQVPGASDNVTIEANQFDNQPDVVIPPSTTVNSLTLGANTDLAGGSLTVTSSFTWSGDGDLATAVTVPAGGTTTISGNGQKVLDASNGGGEGMFTFGGNTTLSGVGLIMRGTAMLTNTGTFTAQPGTVINGAICCINPAIFLNSGQLIIPSSGTSSQSVTITGADFQAGGTISIDRNSALEVQAAPSTFASPVTVNGAGTLLIDNRARIQLGSTITLGQGTTFQLGPGGLLSGTGKLTTMSGNTGIFSWTGGIIQATLTVSNTVSTVISGNAQKDLNANSGNGGGFLTLEGSSSLSGTGLTLDGPAILTSTGVFTPQAGSTMIGSICCVNPSVFLNSGTLLNNVGAGNTFSINNMQFSNSGTVNLQSGTLQFDRPGYIQTGGSTQLNGGSLASLTGGVVTLNGGTLSGTGTVAASITSSALVDPGGPAPSEGLITVTGDYTQTSNGILRIDIKGSTTAGTDYDQLAVSGTATLAGMLDIETVSGFTPKATDHLVILTNGTRTGTFQQPQNIQLPGSLQYWLQYASTTTALRVMTSFSGIDRNDPHNTTPLSNPDTTVTRTTTHVVEGVNSSLHLTNRSGTLVDAVSLATFFKVPSTATGVVDDPRVYFDSNATNPRVIVVALQVNRAAKTSTIWLAVSRSSDPSSLSGGWCVYSIDGNWMTNQQPSRADQPNVGTGTDALVITTNQFTFEATPKFTFAIVRVMDKRALENNATGNCPAKPTITPDQPATNPHDLTIFGLAPVQHMSTPSSFPGVKNPVYLVNTQLVSSSSIYTFVRVSNVASGTPTFTPPFSLSDPDSGYQLPPNAPQKGSSVLLNTGDVSILQAIGWVDTITATHTTLCLNMPNLSCVRVVQFTVGQDSHGNPTVTFVHQWDLAGSAGVFLFTPGIAINAAGQIVLVYQQSSQTSYLSASWTVKSANDANFAVPVPLTTGNCVDGSNMRTGDYMGAALDPTDRMTFWIGGESNSMVSNGCEWVTQLGGVRP